MKKEVEVSWPGREYLKVSVLLGDNGSWSDFEIHAVGDRSFLKLIAEYRNQVKNNTTLKTQDWPIPVGITSGELILREALLKIQMNWPEPFKENEICHCRGVSTEVVDLAICMGAHSIQKIRECTSANTACGTCLSDIENLLSRRIIILKK